MAICPSYMYCAVLHCKMDCVGQRGDRHDAGCRHTSMSLAAQECPPGCTVVLGTLPGCTVVLGGFSTWLCVQDDTPSHMVRLPPPFRDMP